MAPEEDLPDPWLLATSPAFSPALSGPVLDVACGRGRNALWLAARGYRVHGVDASEAAIAYALGRAPGAGGRARFEVRDLEEEGLPSGSWGAALVFHYLDRALFDPLQRCLASGGLLVYKTHLSHPLRGPAARPRRATFRLKPGELLRAFPLLEPLEYREWAGPGHAYAALLARKA
jgi:tellurite methyltransferase